MLLAHRLGHHGVARTTTRRVGALWRSRTFFTLRSAAASTRTVSSDELFHPLSSSPVPAMRDKAARIKKMAQCPVTSLAVDYDCPECGYPTHANREAWEADAEKAKYWPRLREANEDEHDLRSGRSMPEFDLPGPQPREDAVSMGNWDLFFYTRGFSSIDDDRARRHVSKLLTYPMTIGGVLHEYSPYSIRNQRLTREGLRSLSALRQTLHPPLGSNLAKSLNRPTNPIRVFIIGARAESSLPASVWSQLPHLFPADVSFHVFFIGPEVAFPMALSRQTSDSSQRFGSPSRTVAVSPKLTMHSIQAAYREVHPVLGPFDPFNDVYFAFSPGFGFPTVPTPQDPEPSAVQLVTNWNEDVRFILESKCALFCGGFSPADVERDVAAMDSVDGIRGEFDWILTPGENVFASQKWEVAEFDPRVAVKTNFAIWGVRGKRHEVDQLGGGWANRLLR